MQDDNRENQEHDVPPYTQADEERDRLARNQSSSRYYDRRASENEYMHHAMRNAYNSVDKKGKRVGIVLIVWFAICIAALLLCMRLRVVPGIIVSMVMFIGSILISIITIVVKQNQSLSDKNFSQEQKYGVVLSCIMSSSNSVNHRITSVVYRLLVNVDGKEYTAYARTFYNVGDTVVVRLHENPQKMLAHIDVDASYQSAMRKVAPAQRADSYAPETDTLQPADSRIRESEPIVQEGEMPSQAYDPTNTLQATQEPVTEQTPAAQEQQADAPQAPVIDTPTQTPVRAPHRSTQTPNGDSSSTVRKPRKLK